MSQVAIDDIVQEWGSLFSHTTQRLNARVRERLASVGVNADSIEGLHDVFHDHPSPFEGLETRHLQEKYYRDSLGLVVRYNYVVFIEVILLSLCPTPSPQECTHHLIMHMQEPVEIKVGDPYYDSVFTGVKRRLIEKQDTYQYVPLLSSLRSLLSDPTIMDQVEQSQHRVHSDDIIEDVCDGNTFKEHPIFSNDTSALQLITFYDELELCNPLGTHVKKHKLGIVLFTLGNIHPKYRSSLRMINLVIAATLPVIEKHGIDKVFEPFVSDLKILATEGVTILNRGINQVFRGGLLLFLGDNLGSNALGGFKQSFSFSLRFCRTCYITNDTYKSVSESSGLQHRSDDKHRRECDLLTGPLCEHYSKTYGINRRSILLDIPHFNMFKGGLSHDIMHDVLEGVAPLEMSLLLQHGIVTGRYLSFDEYNDRLSHFEYGYTETSKPPPVARHLIANGKPLKASASQALLLVRIFPFLVGDVFPCGNPNWECFMLLSKIVDIVLCPWSSADLCAILKHLITEHHKCFIALYSEMAVIPKHHFLLHYPEQIMNVGPMVRTWNMRNEAKLNVFKQAGRLGNFKNIAFSVAHRHQRLLCYQLSAGNILNSPMECGPCDQPHIVDNEPVNIKESLFSLLPGINVETKIVRPRWVKTDGRTLKKGAIVITGSDGMHPTFSKVLDLLVLLDVLVMEVAQCHVEYFDSHYHAYLIVQSLNKSYILFSDLTDTSVLHTHRKDGNLFVYLKHYFHVV